MPSIHQVRTLIDYNYGIKPVVIPKQSTVLLQPCCNINQFPFVGIKLNIRDKIPMSFLPVQQREMGHYSDQNAVYAPEEHFL